MALACSACVYRKEPPVLNSEYAARRVLICLLAAVLLPFVCPGIKGIFPAASAQELELKPFTLRNDSPLLGFGLDINYEYRFAPLGTMLIEDTAIKSGADVERDYFDRLPLARLIWDYGHDEGFGAVLEGTLREGWSGAYGKSDNLPWDWDAASLSLSGNLLSRGAVYYRSEAFDFALGRDRVDYGGFLYGSLLPSTRLPYLDNARARIKLGRTFKADWLIATIQAVPSWDGIDVNPNAVLDSATQLDSSSSRTGPYGFESWNNPTTIWEVMNRYTWQFDNIIIGIIDHAMIARRNNQFSLCDIFPITSRHQSSVGETNNSMVFEFDWKPLEGLNVAAQYGLDDINGNDFGISDTGSPTIPACVAGVRYTGAVETAGRTIGISAQTEAGYTHYLWGNYSATEVDPAAGYVDTLNRMQYRFLVSDGESILLPLTSPYGPGAIWSKTGASLAVGKTGLTLGAALLFLAKNPDANLIETELYNNTTTDAAGYVHYVEFSMPCNFRLSSWSFGFSPAVQWRDGEWGCDFTFMGSYKLRIGEHNPDSHRAWASPQRDLELN